MRPRGRGRGVEPGPQSHHRHDTGYGRPGQTLARRAAFDSARHLRRDPARCMRQDSARQGCKNSGFAPIADGQGLSNAGRPRGRRGASQAHGLPHLYSGSNVGTHGFEASRACGSNHPTEEDRSAGTPVKSKAWGTEPWARPIGNGCPRSDASPETGYRRFIGYLESPRA